MSNDLSDRSEKMLNMEFIYVMELNGPEGVGYTSVHRTQEGAQAKLEEKIDAWGLREMYEMSEGVATEDSSAGDYYTGGEDGDGPEFSYGIYKLPLED